MRPGNLVSSCVLFKALCNVESAGENRVACECFTRSGALLGSVMDALACSGADKGSIHELVLGHR